MYAVSGTDCACPTGATPGSASAAARGAPAGAPPRSVAATTASADTVAAGGAFLAEIDVQDVLRVELVGVELHRRTREILLLPGLRGVVRGAAAERERQHRGDQAQARQRDAVARSHRNHRAAMAARMRSSTSALRSSLNPFSTHAMRPLASTRYELGIDFTCH